MNDLQHAGLYIRQQVTWSMETLGNESCISEGIFYIYSFLCDLGIVQEEGVELLAR